MSEKKSHHTFDQVKDPVDWARVRRVLVIKLRHHGDVLLTTPLLSEIKAQYPQLELDALIYADTQPMLLGNPNLSQLHVIDKKWKKLTPWRRLVQEWQLLRDLRKRQYDLVLHLTESNRGMWLTRLLAPRWAAAYKGRHVNYFWRRAFTHFVPAPLGAAAARRHTVEKHLDVLRRLGLQPGPARRLDLVPGNRARDNVDTLLAAGQFAPGSFIHVHPASRWFFKCWSAQNNAVLLDALLERGEKIVLTAAPDNKEAAFIEAITQRMRTPLHVLHSQFMNLSAQLSLRDMAALTDLARAFIGVDSAPMHIAAAMQTPAVVLFGPSGDLEWGPWCSPHRLITNQNYACRPCGIDGCGGGKVSECLTSISVSRVLAALDDLLREQAAPTNPGFSLAAVSVLHPQSQPVSQPLV